MTAFADRPDMREAAIQAARNWALMYPIPAWGLAEGDGAEKLAGNWARVVAGMVLFAVEQAIGSAPACGSWVDGVRWAAAEADAQAAGREPVYILDITDHLRACADDPTRGSAVKRDQAPAEYHGDIEEGTHQ